jgi:serine/threonine-protein kinase RsbW
MRMQLNSTQAAAPLFVVDETECAWQVRMGASLTNIDLADEGITKFLDSTRCPVDRFAMRILLREALLNAVTHGSNQDPAREVRVNLAIDEGGASLTVEDTGSGFDWSSRESTFDALGADGGRGLSLMRIYSSEMSFNDRGNRVKLRRLFEKSEAAPNS